MQEQDSRPRDWAYKIAFDRKDLPSLQDMARHIRETHDTDMIEEINAGCEQKLRGEPAELSNGLEIQQVTKTEDLVVNVGLQQCVNIILGTSTDRFTLIRVAGVGGSPPAVGNTNIDVTGGGPFSLVLSTYGWSEARGMKLFFGCIGPQDSGGPLGSSSIGEMGVFSNSGTTMLNRENFNNNPLSRNLVGGVGSVYNAVFIFSCVIEFCPVA